MKRKFFRAFSIVELLVVIGVIAVIASFAFPALSKSRRKVQEVTAAGNVRQIAIWMSLYSMDFKGSVPVLFPLTEKLKQTGFSRVNINGRIALGTWFNNADAVNWMLEDGDRKILYDPSHPMGGREEVPADYSAATCLFTESKYWRPGVTQSVDQWQAQRLDSIRFPSSKGIVSARYLYGVPGQLNNSQGAVTAWLSQSESAAAWGDLSASLQVKGTLRVGVPNQLNPLRDDPISYNELGSPIDETIDGIFGRDR